MLRARYRHVQYFDDILTHKPRRITMVSQVSPGVCDRSSHRAPPVAG